MPTAEFMAWTRLVAFAGTMVRRWAPKKLRARLFETGGRIATHARQTLLHLASTAPEVLLLLKGMKRLAATGPP